jgi:hypothetical protein
MNKHDADEAVEERITKLEAALRYARAVAAIEREYADLERRRADAAEASARRAWQLATWFRRVT